jgi:hypothetical protein
MDGSGDRHVMQNKPGSEKQIFHMRNLDLNNNNNKKGL